MNKYIRVTEHEWEENMCFFISTNSFSRTYIYIYIYIYKYVYIYIHRAHINTIPLPNWHIQIVDFLCGIWWVRTLTESNQWLTEIIFVDTSALIGYGKDWFVRDYRNVTEWDIGLWCWQFCLLVEQHNQITINVWLSQIGTC